MGKVGCHKEELVVLRPNFPLSTVIAAYMAIITMCHGVGVVVLAAAAGLNGGNFRIFRTRNVLLVVVVLFIFDDLSSFTLYSPAAM